MNAEVVNKMIQYIMSRPYNEVYELMDEVRQEVEASKEVEAEVE